MTKSRDSLRMLFQPTSSLMLSITFLRAKEKDNWQMYSGYLKHFVHYGVGCSQKSNILEIQMYNLIYIQIFLADNWDFCAHTMQINCDISHSHIIFDQRKNELYFKFDYDQTILLVHYFHAINRLYYKNKQFMDNVE